MRLHTTLAVLTAAALLTGCATRASGVAPVSIAATDYSNMPCATARERLVTIREQVNALSKRQNTAATVDAIGVFFVLVPVSSLFGGNVEGELAHAKGEQAALERHIVNNCTAA